LFARYVKLERVYVAENTPGWRWCLAAGCGAGQIHVSSEVESEDGDDGSPGLSERIDSDDSHLEVPGSWSLLLNPPAKPDISKCNKCGAKACVPCDRPWHANESCDEYKLRIKDKTEEEDATLAAIQKATKPCPNCSKNILKTGGCKHMYCKSLREPAVLKKRDVRANADLCRYPVPDRVLLGLFAPDQPRRSVLQVQ
jgi:hypothetical protein